jgi:ABC-type multidrug transport system permease subunit
MQELHTDLGGAGAEVACARQIDGRNCRKENSMPDAVVSGQPVSPALLVLTVLTIVLWNVLVAFLREARNDGALADSLLVHIAVTMCILSTFRVLYYVVLAAVHAALVSCGGCAR